MLGLALIVALILWIVVIALSVWLPQKMFKDRPKVAGIVSIIGFMLTCGFWVAKWNMESIAAQKEAREMCKQAGVTIYVQPEKWKEMVGGEEAWKALSNKLNKHIYHTQKDKLAITEYIDFEGERYKLIIKEKYRIGVYSYNLKFSYGILDKYIYYDFITKTVLYKDIRYNPSTVSLDSGFKVLFFKSGKPCQINNDDGFNTFKSFFYIQ